MLQVQRAGAAVNVSSPTGNVADVVYDRLSSLWTALHLWSLQNSVVYWPLSIKTGETQKQLEVADL